MDLIEEHPMLDLSYFKKEKRVEFSFDGATTDGFEGTPIAAALRANGVRVHRETPNMKRPGGFFCEGISPSHPPRPSEVSAA